MINLTVCLLNWKRQDNLNKILDFLYGKVRIFLWDNSGVFPKDTRIDWQISSSVNKKCSPRWWMLQHAETEFVCSMDDDLILSDINDFVDMIYTLQTHPEYAAIGGFGRIKEDPLQEYKRWKYITNTDKDILVDILLGRLIMTKTENIRNIVVDDNEDDIHLSWLLTKNNKKKLIVPSILKNKVIELTDDFALWREEGHFKRRDDAISRYYFIDKRHQIGNILSDNITGCELGVFEGDFSEVLVRTNKFKQLFLVDTFAGKIHGTQEKIYPDGSILFDQVKNRFIMYSEVSVIKQDSVNFLNSIEENSLDFVYIDTVHTYDQTLLELNAARKTVKHNGLICGHDYIETRFPGVCKAVNEFVDKYNLSFRLTQKDEYKSYFITNIK